MQETPDHRLLATFVAVVEENSFSKAALRLRIGKGTVSRAIARLESMVGAELIHRTTHSVALSTAGTTLYERTVRHLKALDDALIDLPERAEEPSGVLRLTTPHDFGVIERADSEESDRILRLHGRLAKAPPALKGSENQRRHATSCPDRGVETVRGQSFSSF